MSCDAGTSAETLDELSTRWYCRVHRGGNLSVGRGREEINILKDILMVLGVGASLYVLFVIGFGVYAILRLAIKGDE